MRRLSSAEVEDLFALHATGVMINDLAVVFGVSRTTVMSQLDRAGVERRSGVTSWKQGTSTVGAGRWFGLASTSTSMPARFGELSVARACRRGHALAVSDARSPTQQRSKTAHMRDPHAIR